MTPRSGSATATAGPSAVLLAAILGAAGCVPARSTIGGHEEVVIRVWEGVASQRCLDRTGQSPPHRFTTDGCTLSPDGTWQACCVKHDMEYWCGGSAGARLEADAAFRACVVEKGGYGPAEVMYRAVRIGGHPWVPVYWRWGYGWPWPRGYAESRRP